MASYSNQLSFHFASEEDQKIIMDYISTFKDSEHIEDISSDSILCGYLDRKKYPPFLSKVAKKFSDKVFVAFQLYNEEGGGVPNYTLSYLSFMDGKIKCESTLWDTIEINQAANRGDWEIMNERIELTKEDANRVSNKKLKKLIKFSNLKTNPNLVISYPFGDSYGEDWSQSVVETVEFTHCVKLGMAIFKNCKKLKSVKLSLNMESINRSAFSGCTALEEVEIFSSMEKIGKGAFADCSNLKKVLYHGTKEQWDRIEFWKGEELTHLVEFVNN